jgi:hypothetical protein
LLLRKSWKVPFFRPCSQALFPSAAPLVDEFCLGSLLSYPAGKGSTASRYSTAPKKRDPPQAAEINGSGRAWSVGHRFSPAAPSRSAATGRTPSAAIIATNHRHRVADLQTTPVRNPRTLLARNRWPLSRAIFTACLVFLDPLSCLLGLS